MNQSKTKNGISFYYSGKTNDPTVVFIHGNSLSSKTYSKQLENLNIPMVAIDLPGHGESDRFTEYENKYCLPGYINSVKEVIQAVNLKEYILIGHSLGGHIAIEASEELNGTKGIMIFGTPAIGIPPEMAKMFLPNPLMNHFFSPQISPPDANALAREIVFDNDSLVLELSDYLLETDGNARLNLGASIGKGQFKDEKNILKNANYKVAIVHGDKDTLVNSDYINSLDVNNLWKNRIHLITECGHTPQLEQSQQFNDLVTDFYKHVFV